MISNRLTCIISGFFFICSCHGQIEAGFTYGIQYPGRQDLKFKKYNAEGQHLQTIKSTEVYSRHSALSSFFINRWKNNWGIGLEYMSWEHISTATDFLSHIAVDRMTTEQSREALLVNVFHRRKLFKPHRKRQYFRGNSSYFMCLGYGMVVTEIDFGLENSLRTGFQAKMGVNLSVSKSINFVIESKYVLTKDADNIGGPANQTVIDTSGDFTPFRFNAHFDTRYYAIQVGLSWLIFHN